jgi:hypothetical protein
MKQENGQIQKSSKPDRNIQRRLSMIDPKFRMKEQNTKRRKIVQTVTAGHVRGGHTFH